MARELGAVNWRGLWTLYAKEVRRFLNVATQTILAPVVTSLLFLAIFTLALGRTVPSLGSVSFARAFALLMSRLGYARYGAQGGDWGAQVTTRIGTLVIVKIQGSIVDLLMPPLSPSEQALGIAGGGLTRGLVVGLAVGLAMWVFLPIGLYDPVFVVFHAVNASLMLALLGMVGGIWSEKFDHIAAVTNFVITPLSFLSGTFYSIERLPDNWHLIALLNPFFYLIDGFRYGFIGHADGSLWVGALVVLTANAGLWTLVHRMISTGYRLKP